MLDGQKEVLLHAPQEMVVVTDLDSLERGLDTFTEEEREVNGYHDSKMDPPCSKEVYL